MNRPMLFTASVIAVLTMGLGSAPSAAAFDLSEFRWKNRLILLFAPDLRHPYLEAFEGEIAHWEAEVQDRDLVVFKIIESGPSVAGERPLETFQAKALRKSLDITAGRFTVILIGKDGGEKFRRNDRVSLREIFSLIDAMPMRREEVRSRKAGQIK